jgi:hypothetical protein
MIGLMAKNHVFVLKVFTQALDLLKGPSKECEFPLEKYECDRLGSGANASANPKAGAADLKRG